MMFQKPRLVVAALKGGSGKTVISLGLIAALRHNYGLRIVPFKKGPDYIDAGWLSKAADHPCYNLDPFLMGPDEILLSFMQRSRKGDGSIVEGNRGLYDGLDADGSCSTAELAKLLRAPVVLVIEATKVTRTAAALVLGCQHLDPQVPIAGVVLNQVAGKRHEGVLRGAIEKYCGIPVLGVVPKEGGSGIFPERHMGLVPPQEHDRFQDAVHMAAERMVRYLDIDKIWSVAGKALPLGWPVASAVGTENDKALGVPPVIGVIRDAAFQFYYPENLETLERKGATIKEISSLESAPLPSLDALYIGGGFPETHLEILAANDVFRKSLRKAVDSGLPVYAECGGLMFLCRGICFGGNTYPMVDLFPFEVVLERKPQGHGYTIQECVGDNPFFPKGIVLRGHEFHYSRIVGMGSDLHFPFVFRMQKGHGIVPGWDGMCYKNALACYSHIHVVGNEHWAEAMIRAALRFRHESSQGMVDPKADRKSGMAGVNQYLNVY